MACTAALHSTHAAGDGADRVLLLGRRDHAAAQAVIAGFHDLPLDVRWFERGTDAAALVRELAPRLSRYRAAYVTTMGVARALQVARPALPIVFHGAADPVQTCLVDSLARPGRNATGFTSYLRTEEAKLLEALAYGHPQLRRVYVLTSDDNTFGDRCDGSPPLPPAPPCREGEVEPDERLRQGFAVEAVQQQARQLRLELRFVRVCSGGPLARLAAYGSGRADSGFLVPWQPLFTTGAAELVPALRATGRPAIYGRRSFIAHGAVLAMEPSSDELDLAGSLAVLRQVVAGRAPATLPVLLPRGHRLTVAPAHAQPDSLRPSLALLRRADEIVPPGDPR